MLRYLANVRVGSALDNLVHTLVGPIALLLAAFVLPAPHLTHMA
jgi:hypothetical protein